MVEFGEHTITCTEGKYIKQKMCSLIKLLHKAYTNILYNFQSYVQQLH